MEKVGKRFGNLEDLPQELKTQLQIFNTKEIEEKIIHTIRSYDGIANIDEVLVGLYRHYNLIYKRMDVNTRLYRMYKTGKLKREEGRKGVYKLIY